MKEQFKKITVSLSGISSNRLDQIVRLLHSHNIDASADFKFTQLVIKYNPKTSSFGVKERETIAQVIQTFNLTVIPPYITVGQPFYHKFQNKVFIALGLNNREYGLHSEHYSIYIMADDKGKYNDSWYEMPMPNEHITTDLTETNSETYHQSNIHILDCTNYDRSTVVDICATLGMNSIPYFSNECENFIAFRKDSGFEQVLSHYDIVLPNTFVDYGYFQ